MLSSDIAILNIESIHYCCTIRGIQSEAINLMQNIDLTEKNRASQYIKIYYHV